MADAIGEARRALVALRLEVPGDVADDIRVKVNAALVEAFCAGAVWHHGALCGGPHGLQDDDAEWTITEAERRFSEDMT